MSRAWRPGSGQLTSVPGVEASGTLNNLEEEEEEEEEEEDGDSRDFGYEEEEPSRGAGPRRIPCRMKFLSCCIVDMPGNAQEKGQSHKEGTKQSEDLRRALESGRLCREADMYD